MNTISAVVGIDVGKKKLDVVLLVNGKSKSKAIDNNCAQGHQQLLAWLSKQNIDMKTLHVCMEATGVYYERVATALHDAGVKVSVVNPGCVKSFGQSENIRNKNDAVDAGLIARYCIAMHPLAWEPAPLEQRQLGAWTMRIEALKEIVQQEENRLEALVESDIADVAEHVRGHIAWLNGEIKKLKINVDDHIDRHPGLKHDAELMASIPGVGATTVMRVLGQVGDLRRFARRHNPILSAFADRLRATGMAKKAVIGAVMHKLAPLLYGVIHTGKSFDANYLSKGLAIQDGI